MKVALLTAKFLATAALTWAMGEKLPFNCCECLLQYLIIRDECIAHIRLCAKTSPAYEPRVGDWSRCYDESATADGSEEILAFQVRTEGPLDDFIASLCSAVYCKVPSDA